MTPSILDPLLAWTEQHPDKLLYAFLDSEGAVTESYTYAQFVQRTADIAAHLQRVRPMAPGERVLLAYPPGLEVICAFFACVRLGLLPVPVYPATSHGFRAALEKTEFIARDCRASAVLTDRAYYWSMKVNEARHSIARLSFGRKVLSKLPWIITSDADRAGDARLVSAHSDVVFLQYTSGSTSSPRGVMVTHDNIIANCDAVIDHCPIGVSWLPQYHDMGLIGYYLFIALKGGTTYGFSPADFIEQPMLWLETLSKYRGTASSAPNFAYEYCLRPEKLPAKLDHLDLSALQILMTAAEPVSAQICRAFVSKFEPLGLNPRSFSSAYGLAEGTLAVSMRGSAIRNFDRAALKQNRVVSLNRDTGPGVTTLVSSGKAVGATEIRIVDVTAESPAAIEGAVGEIWTRGPSKCGGYWGKPELNAEIFGARLPGDINGSPTWLRTGDLGFVHEDELYICGRRKDMLIVRGLNYYPQDIEAIVQEDGRIRRGCVAAFACDGEQGESLVVVAEVKDRRNLPDARVLNLNLVQRLGVSASSFVFIEARTIPKTSSGKIVRHLASERWMARQLKVIRQVDVAATMDEAESSGPRDWLRPFGLTGTETWTLREAGFDSIRVVEFSQALKQELERRGEQELANAIDLRVLEQIAICELFELFDQVALSAPHARLRLKRALSELGQQHRAAEAEQMRRDTRLAFDIATLPALALPGLATSQRPHVSPGCVLLTGGTGFFGPFLLASLLEQTADEIYVLTRGAHDKVMQRIRYGLGALAVDGASAPQGWERRVRPVSGDLAARNLGLGDELWRTLANDVHAIYHNGAQVNYLLDYEAMRGANVDGTNEVIRLAMSHRPKVLNHVSTTFVFGWSVQETLTEQDANAAMERLDFGYSQGKWVAEQLVLRAMTEGLHARVFRPALLTPSLDGGGYNFDIAIRLLAFMMNHGIGTTARNQVSFSPANLAADNIVAISQVPDTMGATFHVTRDDYANMGDITSILADLTGQKFRNYDLHAFVPEIIKRCRPSDALYPLMDFLVRSVDNISAMEFKRYDNSNFRRARAASVNGRPDPPLHDVVLGMLRFMRRHGLVSI
jgi:thioester reductase-like protein